MSKPLRFYNDPSEIRARLAVLLEKANRVVAYNASCEAGTPDVELLDEKQRQKLADLGRKVGQPLPILHTLGQTMDVHKGQLHSIWQREQNNARPEGAA